MTKNSSLFDSIRIKPRRSPKEKKPEGPICAWEGCEKVATHKAPRGRMAEGEYIHFCIDHVREYNKSYNYFTGMGDDAVKSFQKDAMTGHRPTWDMGANAWGENGRKPDAGDPVSWKEERVTNRYDRASRRNARIAAVNGLRKLKPLELKALETLELDATADSSAIKTRYKALVKKHHPDLNGGDPDAADKLRDIISAYNHLKAAGMTS